MNGRNRVMAAEKAVRLERDRAMQAEVGTRRERDNAMLQMHRVDTEAATARAVAEFIRKDLLGGRQAPTTDPGRGRSQTRT